MNRNVHTTTASPYWREYAWKIQSRFFITSVQQVKYNKKILSNCWRECGESHANFSHIFWFCPLLQLFWNNIQREINTIFNGVIHLNTDFMLLGKTVDKIQNENDKYLLRILRITALKQITRNSKYSDITYSLTHRDKIAKELNSMVSFLLRKLKYRWPQVKQGFRAKSFPHVLLLISTSRVQLVLHAH